MLRPREGSTAFVKDHAIREIPTRVVEIRELRPPKNQQPLRWVLYSQEPASTFQEALRVVGHYEQRPQVEEYHKCLKTGLGVECRRYQSSDRLEPVIGVICVQAVRLLQLRDIARKSPDTPAKGFVPTEWLETMQRIVKRPIAIHTVRDFLRAVAGLGGFLGRKRDGEPGWLTLCVRPGNPPDRPPRLPRRTKKMWVTMSPARGTYSPSVTVNVLPASGRLSTWHVAAVEQGQFLDDRKAQPAAENVARLVVADPHEFAEELLEFFCRSCRCRYR